MSDLVEKVARTLWLEQELGLPQRTRIPFEERKSDLVIDQAKAAIATVLREMMKPSREVELAGADQLGTDKWRDTAVDVYTAMLRSFAAEHGIEIEANAEKF